MRHWLKDLREIKGFSQQFVADSLGISQQYYCYIENGERQADLTLSTVEKLSKVFDVTVEKIIQYEKKEEKMSKYFMQYPLKISDSDKTSNMPFEVAFDMCNEAFCDGFITAIHFMTDKELISPEQCVELIFKLVTHHKEYNRFLEKAKPLGN